MAATFQQLWQATGAKVGELQPASVRALCAPPLACLPPEIAAERLVRLREVPFADLFSLVAVLNTCRPDDHMVALELLGVVEGDEALEGAPEEAAVQIPQLPAPPKPEPPPGPPAPVPLTLPAAPAEPVAGPVGAPERHCKQCGGLFRSWRTRQLFCSKRCQSDNHNGRRLAARAAARPIKTCPECGVTFQPQRRSTQQYCSEPCARAAVYTQRGEVPPWQRPPRECVVCAAPFRPVKGTQKTCSEACSLTWQRQRNNSHVDTARITELAEQFSPEGRWRWLLRQIDELGLDRVAELAELEPRQLLVVMARIRAQAPRSAAA